MTVRPITTNEEQRHIREQFGEHMNSRKLFVGNLTYSVNARQLSELFSQYGVVISVNVLEKKGYGFIEMKTPEEAEKARNALSETEFEGRKLLIDGVRPPLRKKKSSQKPGNDRSGQRPSSGSAGSGYRGKNPRDNQGRGSGRSGSNPRKGFIQSSPNRTGAGRGRR